VDAEQEYLLRKLLEGYLPAPAPVPERGAVPRVAPGEQATTSPPAVWESLDPYAQVFFAEGASLASLESVAAPWRSSGLAVSEVRQWLAAGVYPDEPDLAVALAGAGFDPYEARRRTIRYRSDSEQLNVISAVRGRSEQAAWARELKERIRAVDAADGALRAG
jgi:hypothetical protein